MTSVSALKIFKLFGQKLSYAQAVSSSLNDPTMVNPDNSAALAAPAPLPVSSTAPPPPPGSWDQMWTLLTNMNDGIKSLQTSVTTLGTGLEKNTTELASFKAEFGGRLEQLEQKYDELTGGLDSRFDDFKEEVRNDLTGQVELKLAEWKQSIKNEIVAELKNDIGEGSVSLFPPGLPKTNIGQKFQHLLRLSRSLENNFCMGHSKQKTPTVRAQSVLHQFFPEFEISCGGNSSAAVAALVRFSVPQKQSAQFRAKLQEVRGAILTYGWWVAQENLADLRGMYTLTNDFLKFAKSNKPALKAFFLTIECGWVFLRDQPIFPVFLVPADSTEWDVLSGLLLVKLKSTQGVDWLSRVAEPPKPDVAFLGRWLEAMKLRKELAESLVPLFSSQDGEDAIMQDGQASTITG
jgi:hypothetical protein